MELQLKNIGMIKEANVKINGLTVIAGENDTGKSTVGKALFLHLKVAISNNKDYVEHHKLEGLLFNRQISDLGEIKLLVNNDTIFISTFGNYTEVDFFDKNNFVYLPIMIETPLVWNFTDFFRDIAQIESEMRIELDYPYLMKDLNFKLHIKSALDGLDIKKEVTDLMGGEFKKDEMGRYYFDKLGQRIELVNTATGIKYFGIFQVLSQNNYLNKDTVLVLDEPEVHLHPKWQLEMAKIIVELVKNGVKIVVNSHSPYMIEALQRYSELSKINSDFYIAEDGYIKKVNDSNAETLSKIFEKLSEPFDVFDEMDSQSMEKLING
jgi:predicted ATPase